MASVWIARHTGKHGFEKFVAIKTVLPKFAADARFQTMFQDEARIASRIEHTNVAQILDVGEQHDITYLVMEYVDGESLSTVHRALTKKGMKVPPGVILRVLADVCGGLHTAHELREEDGQLLGVVHRDVSPQNVLVSMKGVAKLIDFGIAKARDRIAGDTSAGQVKGKIRYMAPEQAMGSTVDRRADLWAVGAILYHLLSGKPPYDGDNDVQALMVLTSGRPPVPLPASVHPAIAAVVKRALTATIENRFATAAEMQQALEDAMLEAKLQTNSAAVAAFLAEHVSERAKKRKEAISIGVKAAAERERYAEIMRSNVKATTGTIASGVEDPAALGPGHGSRSGHESRNGFESNPGVGSNGGIGSNPGARSRSGLGSNPGGGSRSGVAHPSPNSLPGNSVVTSGTLGSAAMDVGVAKPARGRTVAFASIGVGALLGVGGLVVMLTRGPSSDPQPPPAPKAATQAPPPAATSVAPPATTRTVTVTTPWTATPPPPTVPTATAPAAPATVDTTSAPIPTVSPNALPPAPPTTTATAVAPPPVPVAPPFQQQRPAAVPHPTAPAVRPGRPKPRIDDGF